MVITGYGTIADLLGDFVAYRSLRPCDARLSGFAVPPIPPRKIDVAYADAVRNLLVHARQLDAPGVPIKQIIVVGDNVPTDGAAFQHLRARGGWNGVALIVDEQAGPQAALPSQVPEDGVLLLSRWSDLLRWAEQQTVIPIDRSTAVLIDVDKTLLGARGRNDAVIDQARTAAMRAVLADRLGESFDEATFTRARQTFNARSFHGLTGDNQDYVAYICLLVAGGLIPAGELESAVRDARIRSVADLVAHAESRISRAPAGLLAAHREVAGRVASGDPTPYKAFREREFRETVGRMGRASADPLSVRLTAEIFLTGEVFNLARRWQAAGALLFALSDKPDEAALPTASAAGQGLRPLHHTPAYIVAEAAYPSVH